MGLTKHYNKIPFRELKDEALEANGTGGFLTKSCPLMPSGHWEKVTFSLWKESSEATTVKVTRLKNRTDDEYVIGYVGGNEITESGVDVSTSTTSTLWVRLLAPSQKVMFGECRCSYEHEAGAYTTDISIQGDVGWLVSNAIQQYSWGKNTAITQLQPQKHVYVTIYCYVIPYEYITSTEE